MTPKEELEQEAYDCGVPVDYINFKSDQLCGLYIDGSIALKSGMSTAQATDTLAEELEHHYTTVGNILNQNSVVNRKQERIARLRAYDRRIGLSGIIQGYRRHCLNRYELAEYLGVTEGFLQEAIDCYKEKYGTFAELDGYIIFFDPSFGVMEKF
ncbi:MAG: hypothetical protein SOX46_14205 [Clostridiaceae bacterium]|uniref:IrrE N-terminal-like domain-containing protein n=1 Tax=Clostridium porci TaxID=2605778 RepID=A0A7X2NKU6_9CLOT|nr:hypothetical protein [Clostridium porci]MCI6369289.1 hypothetical protein [Limosilactobacillus reuteri]MCI7182334.1 hypothetical protein [Lachnospiraceae bacterium]MDY3232700.1 hypothetical protein [Clostridiaceae bacterium]MDY5247640.1 hypothetical protein [Ligilactobacillus salivarius]MSS36648.1 hypothetical protein [Clostridium porci]